MVVAPRDRRPTMTFSPQGAIVDQDLGSVLGGFGGGSMMGGGFADNLSTTSFIPLSPDPVGPGDQFGSGSLSLPRTGPAADRPDARAQVADCADRAPAAE